MKPQRIDYALSPEQRADARQALALLAGSGLTLTEAARKALHGRRAMRRLTVAAAVNEFLRTRLALRARTFEWYESKLAGLVAEFGKRMFDDVDRPALTVWLQDRRGTEGGKAAIVRACRALWNWGMAQDPQLVTVDATAGLSGASRGSQGDAKFLSAAQVSACLANAGAYRSAMALLFFSGIRPEELAGRGKPPLLWRHVRAEERIVRVPADVSKTGKPRIVEGMPEALWRWLEPGRDEDPVSPGRTRQVLERCQAAIAPAPWPHDATRHTFATYALALTGDPGKVAMWLGHEGNPTMLHRHYRGLATKAEADKFFALRPTS